MRLYCLIGTDCVVSFLHSTTQTAWISVRVADHLCAAVWRDTALCQPVQSSPVDEVGTYVCMYVSAYVCLYGSIVSSQSVRQAERRSSNQSESDKAPCVCGQLIGRCCAAQSFSNSASQSRTATKSNNKHSARNEFLLFSQHLIFYFLRGVSFFVSVKCQFNAVVVSRCCAGTVLCLRQANCNFFNNIEVCINNKIYVNKVRLRNKLSVMWNITQFPYSFFRYTVKNNNKRFCCACRCCRFEEVS